MELRTPFAYFFLILNYKDPLRMDNISTENI